MSVTLAKRAQGRPVRGEGDVGREKLVEAARSILRRPLSPEISRKAVAEAAGVTPALVSYYFPSKKALMAAAVAPLLGQRVGQLFAILEANESYPTRLLGLTVLLIELNVREVHLVDYMFDFCRGDLADANQKSVLSSAYDQARHFVSGGIDAGEWRSVDADAFLHTLWGMCKSTALTIGSLADAHRSDAVIEAHAERLVDLMLNGLNRR